MPKQGQVFSDYTFSDSPYMRIDMQEIDGRKTPIFTISDKVNLVQLGEIKWHAPWRGFCFFPEGECVFDSGCLGKIIEWVEAANKQYKANRNVVFVGREPRVCPVCSSIIAFDPYFGRHVCRHCGFAMDNEAVLPPQGILSALRAGGGENNGE